jgi:phosphatidylglycerophosphate synthase
MSTKSAKTLFVNALTFSRVPLIFIYLALAIAGNFSDSFVLPLAACVAAGAAGCSDFFDGLLARRWGVVSEFGKMADPLMDKVYFIVAFPSLVWLASVQGESVVHAVSLLVFTVLWIPVAALGMALYEWLEPAVDGLMHKSREKSRHG